MSKNIEILNRLKEYLKDEDNIKVENDKISLYTVYSILDENFKELYKRKECDNLLKKINREMKVKKVRDFFNGKDISAEPYNFLFIYLCFSESNVKMGFYGGEYKTGFHISKDIDSDELYTTGHNLTENQNRFIDKHYDEILEILNSFQNFKNITGLDSTDYLDKGQFFSDGFLNINLTYDCLGRIFANVKISDFYDLDNIVKRDYVRNNIRDMLIDNKIQILKNFFVDKDELDETIQKVLKR